jgi:drug/metabolite transporter (DMT)-like permease
VLPTALALASSVVWGASDFVGGLLARRYPLLLFVVLSQAAGLLSLAAVAVSADLRLDAAGVRLGLLAGIFGGLSVVFFFQAAAVGALSVASPLLASGSVVAFGLALASGETVGQLTLAGAALTFAGVFLTALGEDPVRETEHRAGLAFALAAPLALGLFLYLLGRGSDTGGSPAAVLGARATSFALLLCLAAVVRPSFWRVGWRGVAACTGQGIGAAAAVLLFGLAAQVGLISIAAVLSSLYPVVTVLLAYVLLGERLRGPQFVGVPLVLLGVALVTAR